MWYFSRFYVYHMINGRTLIGPETDNAEYPDVKPVSMEDMMRQYDPDALSKVLFTL